MSHKYEKPKPTGKEYVLAVKEFERATINLLQKLPEKWKTYTLDPIFAAVNEINRLTVLANSVYIPNTKETEDGSNGTFDEETLNAYIKRTQYLYEAVQNFSVFDDALDDLFSQIDLLYAETGRIKKIIQEIAAEEISKREETEGIKLEINVQMRPGELQYTTVTGTKRTKLGITATNKDNLLRLEQKALTAVQNKIKRDNAIIKSMRQKKEAQTTHKT